MYEFKTEFVGSSTAKPNQYKIWHTEKDKSGLYRLTKPLVEDVLTGKMMEPDRFLKMADVEEMTQNFLVAKALNAFAQHGTIPRVTYIEDREQPRIEDITDHS